MRHTGSIFFSFALVVSIATTVTALGMPVASPTCKSSLRTVAFSAAGLWTPHGDRNVVAVEVVGAAMVDDLRRTFLGGLHLG